MGHYPVHDVSVVILRPSAKHPVVVVLVFDAVFESQRKVQLRVSPNEMYFTGSKKSVRFEGLARKTQFCSAGYGFDAGRSGPNG